MKTLHQFELPNMSGGGVEGLPSLPVQLKKFPRFRYMGSKFRLVDWIHETLSEFEFDSAIDAFSGSGVISYLMKSMGKQVHSNDSLVFPSTLTAAIIANNTIKLTARDVELLLTSKAKGDNEKFVQNTFDGIFYTREDLVFLDDLWSGIRQLKSPTKKAMAISAILRSCIKRQPRGLFTVAGDPERYKDGRRDLVLNLKEHFVEQVQMYNSSVFSNGKSNRSTSLDVLEIPRSANLVYMDPPYVPRSDDNCYVKRYHFLEGLSCYWEGKEIMYNSKVRKITKPFTPYSYRKTAIEAFDELFKHFSESTQVLSYSSNAYPDLDTLTDLMSKYKKHVEVRSIEHRYHFGNHKTVKRNQVQEYLVVGRS